jgi:hypothetical protein
MTDRPVAADKIGSVNTELAASAFRIEKRRTNATLTLSSGKAIQGSFFIAGGSALHAGPERVGDLLNAEPGFLPFEIDDGERTQTVLYNRSQIVMVELAGHEARRDPGYDVATARTVSALLTTGHRVVGTVRVYRPRGRDRLSDWARQPEAFRYVESADVTLVINVAHIVEVSEMSES